MKKFRSRLQSLHRLRDQQEQLARARVAACQQRVAAVEQRIVEVRSSLDATSTGMDTLFTQQPGAETINGTRALYCSQQSQLVASQQEQIGVTAEMEQALAQWHATRADLKGISNRIESQRSEHRRDAFLQEEHRQQEAAAQSLFQRAGETRGVTEL